MKKSIFWHKHCLKSQKQYLAELKRQVEVAQKNYENCLNSTLFYEKQIEEAEKEGKDGFDPDKYLKKRQTK